MGYRYEELTVWQKAMELAEAAYAYTRGFPADERYGLTAQIRRSAVSVPSNIAEGQGRLNRREFRHFLGHARGSLYEARTQMTLAEKLDYLDAKQLDEFNRAAADVGNLLNALIQSLGREPDTRNSKLETRN